jgi:hypothetical protein
MSSVLRGDVHINRSWLSVRWDDEHRCICAEFKGFANSAEFRTGTMGILDAIHDRGAESLVSDNRLLDLLSTEDQLWIRDIWTPLAVAAGLRRIALVVAHQSLGTYASNDIVSSFPNGLFVTRTFGTLDQALPWAGAWR